MICMSRITINTNSLSSNLINKITSFMYYTVGIEIDMLIDSNSISFDESSLTPIQKNEFFQLLHSYNKKSRKYRKFVENVKTSETEPFFPV